MRRTYFNLGFKSHCSLGLSNLNNILGFLDCKCFSLLLNRNYFSNNVCSCCRGLDRGSCSAHRSSSCPGPHRPPAPAGTPAACWQTPRYIQLSSTSCLAPTGTPTACWQTPTIYICVIKINFVNQFFIVFFFYNFVSSSSNSLLLFCLFFDF